MSATTSESVLSLDINGSECIVDVENFQVTTVLTNTGEETLTILNDPLSPLTTAPTQVFRVVNLDNEIEPRFKGIMVRWSPALAAQSKAWTILAPGESVEKTHALDRVFDFRESGEGRYEVTPNHRFYLVKDQEKEEPEIKQIEAVLVKTLTASLTGKLVKDKAKIQAPEAVSPPLGGAGEVAE